MPTLDELTAELRAEGPLPENSILMQTYGGMGSRVLGEIRLYQNAHQLGANHLGALDFELERLTVEELRRLDLDGQDLSTLADDIERRLDLPVPTDDVTRLTELAEYVRNARFGRAGDPAPISIQPVPDAHTIRFSVRGGGGHDVSQLSRSVSEYLGKKNDSAILLEETMMLENADVIYFGLTGREAQIRDSVTTQELLMILNRPDLLSKTVFFRL